MHGTCFTNVLVSGNDNAIGENIKAFETALYGGLE
jgi:hypothetical protein